MAYIPEFAGRTGKSVMPVKIYRSDGFVEYTGDEIALIRETAYKYCLPNFIDGLEDQLDNNPNNE